MADRVVIVADFRSHPPVYIYMLSFSWLWVLEI